MKDPKNSTNWDALKLEDRTQWLHAYRAWLGKGKSI